MNTLEVEQQVSNTKKELYTTIHIERAKHPMTQKKLAERVGVERQKKIEVKVKAYNLENQEVTFDYDEFGNITRAYIDGDYDADLTRTIQDAIRNRRWDMLKGLGVGLTDKIYENFGLDALMGKRTLSPKSIGTGAYVAGQFFGDLASIVGGGAEFLGGFSWFVGGNAGALTLTVPTGGGSAAAIPAISGVGVAGMAHGAGTNWNAFGSMGNGYNYNSPNYNELGKENTPSELIKKLEHDGWVKELQAGGSKSGPATIMKNPTTGETIRIHANPGSGKPYFRVQNKGGNYLDATGKFPSNASRQEMRDLAHFFFD